MDQEHYAGFVGIIGNPNAGKSTLINSILGEKVAIVTSKIQTTRQRIFGIYNDNKHQVVFSDTPGLIRKPVNELHQFMNKSIKESFQDSDVLLYVVGFDTYQEYQQEFIDKLRKVKIPIIVILNKVDLSKSPQEITSAVEFWNKQLPEAEILPISAKYSLNTDLILQKILRLIPLSSPFYDKEMYTTQTERFYVDEIIREKIFLNYQKEVPYSSHVQTQVFTNKENLLKIETVIYVERESQKGIIIGHKGSTIQKVGRQARKELENFFNKKIYLNLYVKVKKDWRTDLKDLKKFGFT